MQEWVIAAAEADELGQVTVATSEWPFTIRVAWRRTNAVLPGPG
jgi:hypothetical protein